MYWSRLFLKAVHLVALVSAQGTLRVSQIACDDGSMSRNRESCPPTAHGVQAGIVSIAPRDAEPDLTITYTFTAASAETTTYTISADSTVTVVTTTTETMDIPTGTTTVTTTTTSVDEEMFTTSIVSTAVPTTTFFPPTPSSSSSASSASSSTSSTSSTFPSSSSSSLSLSTSSTTSSVLTSSSSSPTSSSTSSSSSLSSSSLSTSSTTSSVSSSTSNTSSSSSTTPTIVLQAATPYIYAGTYQNPGGSIIDNALTQGNPGSIEACAADCSAGYVNSGNRAQYVYMSYQAGDQCLCGSALDSSATTSNGPTDACTGNQSEVCGGYDSSGGYDIAVVYSIVVSSSTSSTATSSLSSSSSSTSTTVATSSLSTTSTSVSFSSSSVPPSSPLTTSSSSSSSSSASSTVSFSTSSTSSSIPPSSSSAASSSSSSSSSISSTPFSSPSTSSSTSSTSSTSSSSTASASCPAPTVTVTETITTTLNAATSPTSGSSSTASNSPATISSNPTSSSPTSSSSTTTSPPAGPTTVQQAGTYIYQNCYADFTSPRPIDGPNDFSITSIEDCATYCYNSATGPYTYFGIEYTYQCFCSNALDVSQGLSTNCKLPCSGSSNELCGGGNAMDVYSATNLPATTFATSTVAAGPTTVPTAAPYVHAACYVDNLNGRLLGVAEDDNTGSIELCASHCVAAAGGPYAYFGMEYYSQCFCGNAYNESAPASTGCSFPCAGNGGEICGGSNAMDLYYNTQLVATAPPRPTPT